MDPSTLVATLTKAQALVATPETWIAHEYAACPDGHWKPVGSREAARFSLWGAIMRAGASREQLEALRALFERIAPDRIKAARAGKLTHPETLSLLEDAVRALAKGGSERPPAPRNDTDQRGASNDASG